MQNNFKILLLIALPIAKLLLTVGILLVILNWFGLVGYFKFFDSNQVIALVAVVTLFLMYISSERARKLFVGQNMPQIDVTPTKVIQISTTHVATLFSVANYSGFAAYDICIDIRYGDNAWIGEWIRAQKEKNEKLSTSTVMLEMPYDLGLAFSLGDLKPGKHYGFPENGLTGCLRFSGSLNLENEVCIEGKDGFPIFIRARWNNQKGHTFEKISEYKLICTKEGNGRAFTMIPLNENSI